MVYRCYRGALLTLVEVGQVAAAAYLVSERLNRGLQVLHLVKGEWPIQVEVFGYHYPPCCLVLAVEEEEPEKTLCVWEVDVEMGADFNPDLTVEQASSRDPG